MFIIEFIGNLGKDAAIINHNGISFLSFSVAATNISKDAAGNKIDNTTWVSCTTKPNEALARMLVKGASVFVRGRAKLTTYKSINGTGIDVACRADELRVLSTPADKQTQTQDGSIIQVF